MIKIVDEIINKEGPLRADKSRRSQKYSFFILAVGFLVTLAVFLAAYNSLYNVIGHRHHFEKERLSGRYVAVSSKTDNNSFEFYSTKDEKIYQRIKNSFGATDESSKIRLKSNSLNKIQELGSLWHDIYISCNSTEEVIGTHSEINSDLYLDKSSYYKILQNYNIEGS
ncbi:hypothetical protein ACKGJO_06160 [Gracilimonas sp. Q87]|uniref:hypothetical protein n=1 Tax=Gracilimonas sp. Q87 TaxID=3384766 RepID=UPI0039840836